MEQETSINLGIKEERSRISSILKGRYRIDSILGIGGMGAVYLASDYSNSEQKQIALKVIRPELNLDQETRGRFEAEFNTLSRLDHKNIVKVQNSGSLEDGSLFIAMEYLSGGSLSGLLFSQKQLTYEKVLPLMHKICSGLEYAHAHGVVHRDLKPDNILFDEYFEPRITDFGLAKDQDLAMSLTKTGETVGTAYYMAPEQFRGEVVTHAVDIYALGIIAYELLTGEKPFFHENYVAVATMHMNYSLPKIKDKQKAVPSWFQEIVELCCEKKAKHRFASAQELALALEHYMDKMGVEVTSRIDRPSIPKKGILERIKSLFS